MHEIRSVFIIGSGNVATHLANNLYRVGITISGILSRDLGHAQKLAQQVHSKATTDLNDIPKSESDLILVSISDNNLEEVRNKFRSSIPVVHTSGTFSSSSFDGVFYPLQTFSADRQIDLGKVPFLIEGNTEDLQKQLIKLAQKLSSHVRITSPENRSNIHLSAVWVNNFVNHLIYKADALATSNSVDFKLLLPLLEETVKKAIETDPYTAQTGPARRNDQQTIQAHLDRLKGVDQDIYYLLSKSITDTYNK